jgi:hypothetical protein
MEGRDIMKRQRTIMKKQVCACFVAWGTRQLVLITALFVLAPVFVLVARSAPQGQSGQSNNSPQTATDWKAVEQALGKAGSMSEVNPVIKALRDNGIEVTALHSHMLTETPRLFFMHFWANDDAQKLARGLRAALDKMNIVKAETK